MAAQQSSFEAQRDATADAIQHRYRDGRYHSEVFLLDPHVEELLAKMRARKLQPLVNPQDTIFEFGVGTALNLRHLVCLRKVGYDISSMSYDYCQRYSIEHVGKLVDLPPQTFSVVLCHHTLEHVTNPFDTLVRLRQLLRPGGRLLLFVPFEINRRYRQYVTRDRNHHLFSWNALTCGNLVAASGLTVQQVLIQPYGYQQRFARLAKLGMSWYRLALWVAGLLRPCNEIQLVAHLPDGNADH